MQIEKVKFLVMETSKEIKQTFSNKTILFEDNIKNPITSI